MTQTTDIWEMLEQDAPAGCEAVQDLYSWSLNYDAGRGPFALLLDIIGWSEENVGESIYELSNYNLGYVEVSKLAAAMKEYSERPQDVRSYVDALMEAESA